MKFIRIFSAALLCCPLLVSCEADTEAPVADEIQVRFTLDTLDPVSRAGNSWGDSYTSSAATEGERAVSGFTAYVYQEGNLVCRLDDITSDGGVHTAKVNTTGMASADADKPLTLHVVANTANPGATASLGDLKNLTYTYSPAATATGIAMWGASSARPEPLPGTMGIKTADFGTVRLLRPLAKVQVTVSSTDPNDTFDYLRLVGPVATKAYVVPTYVQSSTASTTDLQRYQSSVGTPASGASANIKFNASSQKVLFYLPEQDNAGKSGANEISMVLSVNGEEYTTPVCFRDYSGETPSDALNIMRNHYYNFTVTVDEGTLSVSSDYWYHVGNEFEF